MVLGGAGVTLLPAMALGVENRRGELAVRRFQPPAPGRAVLLAWRRQSPRAPALRELAAALREASRRREAPPRPAGSPGKGSPAGA
jgi:LysR family hydrogen peroxide-inducible transcriptional activator